MGVQIGQISGSEAKKPEFLSENLLLDSSKKNLAKERAEKLQLSVKSPETLKDAEGIGLEGIGEQEKFGRKISAKSEPPTLRDIAIKLDAVVNELDKALDSGDTKKIDQYKKERDEILDHLETLY
jgi:hypothetical protein